MVIGVCVFIEYSENALDAPMWSIMYSIRNLQPMFQNLMYQSRARSFFSPMPHWPNVSESQVSRTFLGHTNSNSRMPITSAEEKIVTPRCFRGLSGLCPPCLCNEQYIKFHIINFSNEIMYLGIASDGLNGMNFPGKLQWNEFRLGSHIFSWFGVFGRADATHKLSVNIPCAIMSVFHFFHERIDCFRNWSPRCVFMQPWKLTIPVDWSDQRIPSWNTGAHHEQFESHFDIFRLHHFNFNHNFFDFADKFASHPFRAGPIFSSPKKTSWLGWPTAPG